MKMRKKVIASLLAAVMATSLLASCSQGTAEKKSDEQSGNTKTEASGDSGAMVFATDDSLRSLRIPFPIRPFPILSVSAFLFWTEAVP